MHVIAIHQPNFFPWLGFFDKIRECDLFVVLNDCQMSRKEGSWVNRVKIISRGEPFWVTAPIKRPPGIIQDINEVEIVGRKFSRWKEKFKKTLQVNYAGCKCFKVHRDFIFDLIDFPALSLESYNMNAIWRMAWFLGIGDFLEKLRFSNFLNIGTTGTQRLVDITKKLCCDAYLSGEGGVDYIDENLFAENDIELLYRKYEHPIYEQPNTERFVPGLSAIDYIFNVGRKLWS